MHKDTPRAVKLRPADARDVLRQHIGDAMRTLRTPDSLSDEDIHRARKELKRARAHLRLLRSAIGKTAYRRENARLRDVARPLREVRDAQALLKTVDDLIQNEQVASRRTALVKLRRLLEQGRP